MIEFEHPGYLWLGAGAVVLWLVALVVRAPESPSGTVELWRELEARSSSARRRTLANWRLWCATFALCAGALALAAPLRRGTVERASWRVLVDVSPSMYLPWGAVGEPRAPIGPTRLARALTLAAPWLATRTAEHEPITWVRWSEGAFEERRGDTFPSEWSSAPANAREAPPFERCDRAGWAWITDAPRESRVAGVFASGGATVPGAIAEFGGELLEGRGDAIVARPRAVRSVVVAPTLVAPLAELAQAWCNARGLALGGERNVLAIETVNDGADDAVSGGRAGWSVRGRARALTLESDERAWLVSTDPSRVLVAWRPGRVRIALTALEEPAGDPALFAVAWSELFDAARLADPDVVALDERREAGEQLVREPRAVETREAPVEERWSFELGLVAAFFALLLLI
ncbi:MAG: BatA domain-containing protein [Planctomycetes bacterium]|nr:BatA domain-containing protein [Planctomycetota bacterium]